MKESTSHFYSDRDSNIPQLAAQDWEQREAKAVAMEAAELRQYKLQQALELGPRFDLYHLPQNFWLAILPLGETSQSYKESFPKKITGCKDLHHIEDHILFFRSNLPEQEIRENIDLSLLPF